MKISIKKKEIITLINKNEINIMTTTLIKKIKDFFETKCKSNLKNEIIEKISIDTKRDFLRVNIFEIEDNAKPYLIMKNQ